MGTDQESVIGLGDGQRVALPQSKLFHHPLGKGNLALTGDFDEHRLTKTNSMKGVKANLLFQS